MDLPPPSSQSIAIICEATKQLDTAWNGFDLSYEGLLAIIKRLEQPQELGEKDLRELRNAVVQLAKFGSSDASTDVQDLLTHDIVQLFFDEESEDDDLYELLPAHYDYTTRKMIPALDFRDGVEILQCKSFKKRMKHAAHKVAKFVRKHKTAILIGAAAAVSVGIATYFIAGAYGAGAAAAAAGSAASSAPEEEEIAPEFSPPTEQVQPETPQLTWEEVFQPKEDPTVSEQVKVAARHMASRLAHETWDAVAETIALGHEVRKEFAEVANHILPDLLLVDAPGPLTPEQAVEHWREVRAAGHEKIDAWFSTHQAFTYTEEHQAYLREFRPMAINELPPPPTGLLNELTAAGKIARSAKTCEKGALLAQETAGTRLPRHVRSIQNGVWEIDGKNIKRFNREKDFTEKKIKHIFNKPQHNLHQLGLSQDATVEKITEALVELDKAGSLQINAPFKTRVMINGHEVEVRGIVANGELRYGTFFVR